MALNTDHLQRCISTLEQTLKLLELEAPGSINYEVYRNATVKGFELCLETAGKLLKKALKPYFANPTQVDHLVFKDLFRHASKHQLLTPEETKRWFLYRDNRNSTAHDYGISFAEDTLKLLDTFIPDAQQLKKQLDNQRA